MAIGSWNGRHVQQSRRGRSFRLVVWDDPQSLAWIFQRMDAEVTDTSNNNPVLTFEGKRYDLNGLPDDAKELVRGMQVADAQLRMHEDTLKVLAVGRQSMAMQLNEKLKAITPLP
jgi:hypothetical protein